MGPETGILLPVAGASKVRVRLLGGFAAVVGGSEVPDGAWRLRKAKELVKLLALADGHRLHREQAMEALWPGRDPSSAANNLHQAVHAARRAIGGKAILVHDEMVQLDSAVDVDEFELAAADALRAGTADAYERALGLYCGELLPENRYDDWASTERERLAELREQLESGLAELGGPRGRRRAQLPLDASTFVGRGHELAELGALLARTRLLTLTGTGGAGKTRLALELARGVESRYADGALLVELAAVAQGSLVAGAVAEALELRALPGRAVVDALGEELAPRELLLVLDNCEHVLNESASLVDSLLRVAPGLTILVTSREPLRVPGEIVFRVPSLAIPDPDRPAGPEELLRYEAVRLFAERAAAVAPGFSLSEETAGGVARICFRLDGLPLALELAAARIDALAPDALAERLDDRFRLLRTGSRTAPTRQQTLEATLQWSHDLLSPAEATLFRRLAVFAGGFELDAAEEVCSGDGLERVEVADVLARLVEKSLVVVEHRGGARRYRLLETIRAYAGARLAEAAERKVVARRHAGWLTALVERQDSQLSGLEPEQGNLRVALETLLEQEPDEALRLCARVWPFWLRRIELSDARRWLGEALERSPAPSPARVRALLGMASIGVRGADEGFGSGPAEEALQIARQLGDGELEWRAAHFLGSVGFVDDDGARARDALAPALALARRGELAAAEAATVYSLGVAEWLEGDADAAEALFVDSLDRFRALAGSEATVPTPTSIAEMPASIRGAPGLRIVFEDTLQPFADVSCDAAAGYVLLNLANVARTRGTPDRARQMLDEALVLFERAGNERGRADAWGRLANLAREEDRLDEARESFAESLELRRRLGDRRGEALALVGLGLVAINAGDHGRAESLLDEAVTVFRRAGDRWGLVAALWRTADLELVRDRPRIAQERLEDALRVAQETGRVRWLAVTRTNLAEALLLQGDVGRSVELLEQALAGFELRGDEPSASYVRARLDEIAAKATAKGAQRERKDDAARTGTTRPSRRRS
jgi:predicted ATPase